MLHCNNCNAGPVDEMILGFILMSVSSLSPTWIQPAFVAGFFRRAPSMLQLGGASFLFHLMVVKDRATIPDPQRGASSIGTKGTITPGSGYFHERESSPGVPTAGSNGTASGLPGLAPQWQASSRSGGVPLRGRVPGVVLRMQ